jgi:hypothetical protein
VCQRGTYAGRPAGERGWKALRPGSMVVWVRARAERSAVWASMAVRWRKPRLPNWRGRAIWAATGSAASQGRCIRVNTAAHNSASTRARGVKRTFQGMARAKCVRLAYYRIDVHYIERRFHINMHDISKVSAKTHDRNNQN